MAKLYTTEKVLWFASQPKKLHVSPKEAACFSDLAGIVEELVEAGHLEKAVSDGTGEYYVCTHAGLIELYELKIQYRRRSQKSTTEEEQILAKLRADLVPN